MKLRDVTDRVVMEATEQFYEDCSVLTNGIAKVVANTTFRLPRRPRQMGVKQFPYFYAMDLYELFEFARGRKTMSHSYVSKKCEELLEILFTTVSRRRVEPDWAVLGESPLGLCILACGARISLREEEGLISLPEVQVLSGWEEKHFRRVALAHLEGSAEEGVRFRSADVRELFREHGIAV